jgi:hypothetical protein
MVFPDIVFWLNIPDKEYSYTFEATVIITALLAVSNAVRMVYSEEFWMDLPDIDSHFNKSGFHL